MTRISNYEILVNDEHEILLKDIGPWDTYLTITNNIDDILLELGTLLKNNINLYYINSDNITIKVIYKYKSYNKIEFTNFKICKKYKRDKANGNYN